MKQIRQEIVHKLLQAKLAAVHFKLDGEYAESQRWLIRADALNEVVAAFDRHTQKTPA